MPIAREQESILVCTQCGHINPATNKFCGNCGNGLVSLFDAPPTKTVDNRKVVDPSTVTMPDLTEAPSLKPEATPLRPQVVTREAPGSVMTEPRVVEPRPALREEPVAPISGPSFLGLSSDPTATADYLLADEEPRKGGAFRILMMLAIIALIVVGALEWRAIRKMVAEQGAKLQSSPSSEQAPPPASSSDATAPATSEAQPPAGTAATANPTAGAGTDIQQQHPLVEMDLPPQGQQAAQPQQSVPGAVPAANQATPAQQNAQPPAPANPPPSANSTAQPQSVPPGPTASVKPNTVPRVQRASETPAKTLSASIPAKPVQEPKEKLDPAKDPDVLRAEKYLYGPSRNCVAARSLLEQAAGRQNPSAMSHLGAMYATGQCVSADKTLAYIWFSRAYDANPENQWLEKNLTMLWRDMSSSERQVVLKAKSGR